MSKRKSKHEYPMKWITALVLIIILSLALIFTPLGGWVYEGLKVLAMKIFNLSGQGNNNNTNGNNQTGQYYLNLNIVPTNSNRQGFVTHAITVSTNINTTLYPLSLQYRYQGDTVWRTRVTMNSPENDFFGGYYDWQVTCLIKTSNIVSTTVYGISMWTNGQFEFTAVTANVGQLCYSEIGGTYRNWLVFFWYQNPPGGAWFPIATGVTDANGRILPNTVQVNAPLIPALLPAKATININQPFTGMQGDNPLDTFEHIGEAGLINQIPDPNMMTGMNWYIESNTIQLNVR